jgi:hypothetical protein
MGKSVKFTEKPKFSIPVLRPVIGSVILFSILLIFFPPIFQWLLGKEMLIEHFSHLILILSIILCLRIFVFHKNQFQKSLWLIFIFLVILFLEEIDYGSVYGYLPVRNALFMFFGVNNLHNRIHFAGGSFDPYNIFKLTLFLYFFLAFIGAEKLKNKFIPFWPTNREVAGVFIIGLLNDLPLPFFIYRHSYFQELFETLVYFVLLAVIIRGYKTIAFEPCQK